MTALQPKYLEADALEWFAKHFRKQFIKTIDKNKQGVWTKEEAKRVYEGAANIGSGLKSMASGDTISKDRSVYHLEGD